MRIPYSPFLITLVALAGCASPTGADRSANTQRSAESLRDLYQDLASNVETTINALNGVANPPADRDLRSTYSVFVAEFEKLDTQVNQIRAGSDDLKSATEAYIKGWEQEMAEVQNAAIRQSAEQRRAEAQQRFANASVELDRIGENFTNFGTNLREIKTALDNDLNPAGVQALSGVIEDAKDQSASALQDIETIVAALDAIAASLANQAPETERG